MPLEGEKRTFRRWLRGSRVLSYLAAGAFNTLATYLLFVILAQYIPYAVAYSVVYIIGIVLAYWLQSRFVFHVAPAWGTAFAFPLIYVAQYLVGLATISLMIEMFAIDRRIAILAAIATSLPVGFLLSRRLLGRGAQ